MRDQDKRELGIWGKLIDVAIEDGHITAEESFLLKQILDNARVYRQILEEAFEDGQLSEENKKDCIRHRKNIIQSAYEAAEADEVVSEDEISIIETMLDIIRQLQINEKHLSSYWT